ncbi:MAG: NTP transferase domain-containing protein [Coprothermobacterota bacterium]|nr:NTP transferase domain-containing protein [Coprothermobacterota bacterium]
MEERRVVLLNGVTLDFQTQGIRARWTGGEEAIFPYSQHGPFASLLVLAAREENTRHIAATLEAYRQMPQIREQIVLAGPSLDPSPFRGESALKWIVAKYPADLLPTSLKDGLRALSNRSRLVILALANRAPLPADSLRSLLEAAVHFPGRIAIPVLRGERTHPLVFTREVVPSLLHVRKEKGLLYFVKRLGIEVPLFDSRSACP